MGDRDLMTNAQQADHDLGSVTPMVTGIPERSGRGPIRWPGAALEIGGGQVIADQLQVHVRQITQPGVQLGLGRLFRCRHRVDGPLVLIQ